MKKDVMSIRQNLGILSFFLGIIFIFWLVTTKPPTFVKPPQPADLTVTANDTKCPSDMEFKSLPLIGLASYPRSGNTWTRRLIQQATGLYTGSVYWEFERQRELASKDFPGGNVDYKLRKTVCVKTHSFQTSDIQEFEGGAVMLIRNPYRAIVASVFIRDHKEEVNYFKTKEWFKYAAEESEKWKNMAIQWLKHCSRMLVIHYEDMQVDTYHELYKIVKFLNVNVDTKRIMCASQEYPFYQSTGVSVSNKKHRDYLTYDPFSVSLRETIDNHIQIVNKSLASHHQKPLPIDYSTKLF